MDLPLIKKGDAFHKNCYSVWVLIFCLGTPFWLFFEWNAIYKEFNFTNKVCILHAIKICSFSVLYVGVWFFTWAFVFEWNVFFKEFEFYK